MKIIRDKLIELGFEEEMYFIPYKNYYKYTYNLIIKNYAEYIVTIKSFSNWHFEMIKEVKALCKGIKSYPEEVCFKGKISSVNSLQILEILLQATGITDIINLDIPIESNND